MEEPNKAWNDFAIHRLEGLRLDSVEYIKAKQLKDNLFNSLKDELTAEQNKLLVQFEESFACMAALQEEKAYSLGFFDSIKISQYGK